MGKYIHIYVYIWYLYIYIYIYVYVCVHGDRELSTTCACCVTTCHLERWLYSCSKSPHALCLTSTRLRLRKSVSPYPPWKYPSKNFFLSWTIDTSDAGCGYFLVGIASPFPLTNLVSSSFLSGIQRSAVSVGEYPLVSVGDQKYHIHVFQQGRRGWWQEGQREGQELDDRMCFHHIKSESRTQTFKLHAHPIPLCAADYVKLQSHWSCNESEKALLSVDITSFFVCVRVFHIFTCLFVHICLHMTYTNVILPNMRVATFLPTQTWWHVCHTWSKMVSRMTRRRFNVTRRYMNLRAQTRKPAK